MLPELCTRGDATERHQLSTARAFGAQWEMYEYGGTTWGVTVEERIHVVLHELDWQVTDLPGKLVLDAGCGNGTLSAALAERGARVVALDLSPSVFRARRRYHDPRVQFVQGNLFYPPLGSRVFDAVYSCGVFHHTPDTRRCFDALAPTLKTRPEARYFVWLYAERSPLFRWTVEPLMSITRRLPSAILVPLCFGLSPFVEAASRLLTAVGVVDYAPRSIRDRSIQLHDLLSPPFVWYHSVDEVRAWARTSGFGAVEEIDYQPGDDASVETARALRKYRRVCRPGFGLLCRSAEVEQTVTT